MTLKERMNYPELLISAALIAIAFIAIISSFFQFGAFVAIKLFFINGILILLIAGTSYALLLFVLKKVSLTSSWRSRTLFSVTFISLISYTALLVFYLHPIVNAANTGHSRESNDILLMIGALSIMFVLATIEYAKAKTKKNVYLLIHCKDR